MLAGAGIIGSVLRCARALAGAILLASLAACDAGHFLAVDLRTDLLVGQEFDEIEVSLDGSVRATVAPDASDSFLEGLRVTQLAGLPLGTHELVVTLRQDGARVADRTVLVQLVGSTALVVVITRDCRDAVCAIGTACSGGRCVDPSCSALDPAACGDPECALDADCDTRVGCARASCVEGLCFEVARDEACATGELCDPDDGCVTRPGATDAGVPSDAGGPIDAGSPTGQCSGRPAGEVCRAAQGPCDREERCDGSSPDCPTDQLALAGTQCRLGGGPCDSPEACDGSSPLCPPDVQAPDGEPCDLRCGAETCSGGRCVGGVACRDGRVCGCDDLCICDGCKCP